MAEELIGFGQDDDAVLSGGRSERYKGKKNRTDRISICWFFQNEDGSYKMDEGDTPKFKTASYHYAPGLGYIMAKGDYTTEKFGAPKRRIGTFIVKYRTDKAGNLPKNADGKVDLDFEVLEWTFGEDKYRLLANIHSEFSLSTHDIKATCTDDQFQKLSFTACNGQAIWQRNDDLRNKVLQRVKEIEGSLSIARDLSIDQIKEHFNEASAVVGDAASDIDYDDMLADID